MSARLIYLHGQPRIVWLDSFGEGLPIPDTRRAWRPVIYRPPFPVDLPKEAA